MTAKKKTKDKRDGKEQAWQKREGPERGSGGVSYEPTFRGFRGREGCQGGHGGKKSRKKGVNLKKGNRGQNTLNFWGAWGERSCLRGEWWGGSRTAPQGWDREVKT